MYYFVNNINIELHNVFLKKNVSPRFVNKFRNVNSFVYYIVGGQRFDFGKNKVITKPGDVLVMPYGLKYKNRILSADTEYYQIDFNIYDNGKPVAIVDLPTIIPPPISENIYGLFGEAYAKYSSTEIGGEMEVMSIILKLISFLQRYDTFGTVEHKGKTQLTDAMEYINNNYDSNITIDEIAKMLFVSVSSLEKKFKATLGISPTQYRNLVRIEKAKQLLAQGKSIEIVAYETGFSDRYYFSKIFKRITGTSPATFVKNIEL